MAVCRRRTRPKWCRCCSKAALKYRLDGGSVLVPAEAVHEMRLKLASQGVPRSESGGGFELLDQEQPFGTSSFMEKARYHRALEGELSQSITTLASVSNARVHLAIPKRSVFTRRGNKASLPRYWSISIPVVYSTTPRWPALFTWSRPACRI